jgi:hypothetical protein
VLNSAHLSCMQLSQLRLIAGPSAWYWPRLPLSCSPFLPRIVKWSSALRLSFVVFVVLATIQDPRAFFWGWFRLLHETSGDLGPEFNRPKLDVLLVISSAVKPFRDRLHTQKSTKRFKNGDEGGSSLKAVFVKAVGYRSFFTLRSTR